MRSRWPRRRRRRPRASLGLVRQAKREMSVPLVAIGGISSEHAWSLIGGAIDAVTVISALFASVDVHDAARRFAALFDVESQ
jgi:thiamine-phosphate pyrophosphorylase